jgi:hypothetical protein
VQSVLVASWAMLLDLKAVRIVTTILARDVVAFFAVFACQSNLWTNVVTCHGLAFRLSSYTWCVTGLAFLVPRAGLEPATQRL